MADWAKVMGGGAAPTTPAAPVPSGAGGGKWARVMSASPTVRESTDTGGSNLKDLAVPAAVGGGALVGLAALAKAPGRVGSFAKTLNAIRQQFMLSGLAPVKSLAGNVGAGAVASIERGSTRPLREVLSRQTFDDAVAAFKKGTPTGNDASQVILRNPLTGKELPTPGRFMGAADDAVQTALQRAGLDKTEAARQVLQTPLGTNFGKFAESLDNPVMRYLVPFRRTPFNQFYEGGQAFTRAFAGDRGTQRAMAASMGVGGAHGAATSDDSMPVSLGVGTAAAGKYGIPYALAALLGRLMAGGKGDGSIPSSMLPVSEYGITQSVEDPIRPFTKPAAVSALERLTK